MLPTSYPTKGEQRLMLCPCWCFGCSSGPLWYVVTSITSTATVGASYRRVFRCLRVLIFSWSERAWEMKQRKAEEGGSGAENQQIPPLCGHRGWPSMGAWSWGPLYFKKQGGGETIYRWTMAAGGATSGSPMEWQSCLWQYPSLHINISGGRAAGSHVWRQQQWCLHWTGLWFCQLPPLALWLSLLLQPSHK